MGWLIDGVDMGNTSAASVFFLPLECLLSIHVLGFDCSGCCYYTFFPLGLQRQLAPHRVASSLLSSLPFSDVGDGHDGWKMDVFLWVVPKVVCTSFGGSSLVRVRFTARMAQAGKKVE